MLGFTGFVAVVVVVDDDVLFICCEAEAHLVLCSRIDEAVAEVSGPR